MVFLNAGWTDGLSHGARDSLQLRHKVLEVDATKAGGHRNATPFWGSLPSGNREEDDLATTHAHTHTYIYRFSLDMFLFCFVLFVRSFIRSFVLLIFAPFCVFIYLSINLTYLIKIYLIGRYLCNHMCVIHSSLSHSLSHPRRPKRAMERRTE